MSEVEFREMMDKLDFVSGQLQGLATLMAFGIRLQANVSAEQLAESMQAMAPGEGFEGEYKVGYQVIANILTK